MLLLKNCAVGLAVIEGMLLILLRYQFLAGNQYLVNVIIGLLFINAIMLLSILPFIVAHPSHESNENQPLHLEENKTGLVSFLVGWALYASSIIEAMIASGWFKRILFLLFIFWWISSACKSCSRWPDG